MLLFIQNLINENKLTFDNSNFIYDLLYNLKQKYNFLSLKDSVWEQLFMNNIKIPFKETNFDYTINQKLTKFVKNKVMEKDLGLLNNYLIKLKRENINLIQVLKKFYVFFTDLNLDLNDEYFNYLKANSSLFNQILNSLGISDFNNELVKLYNADYFNIAQSLRYNNEPLGEIIKRFKEILKYSNTNPKYLILSNKEVINEFKNSLNYKRIKIIFKHYSKISYLYEKLHTINSIIDMESLKYTLYNLDLQTLENLFNTIEDSRNNNDLFYINFLNKINIWKSTTDLTKDDMLNKLCLIFNYDIYQHNDKKDLVTNLYNNEHYINQIYLDFVLIYKIYDTESVGTITLQRVKEKYYNANYAPKSYENIYAYILGNDLYNIDRRNMIDLVLSLVTPEDLKNIDLYFKGKLTDANTKKIVNTKIRFLSRKYHNLITTKRPITNIYNLMINAKDDSEISRKIVDYLVSLETDEDIKMIDSFFNGTLSSTLYPKLYNLLYKITIDFQKWQEINNFHATDNELFNEIYSNLSKRDLKNTEEFIPITNELNAYFLPLIPNAHLRNIIIGGLSKVYSKYLSNSNNPIYNKISEQLCNIYVISSNTYLMDILVNTLSTREIYILRNYFAFHECEFIALKIIRKIYEDYNYYLLNSVFPKEYYLENLLFQINKEWFQNNKLVKEENNARDNLKEIYTSLKKQYEYLKINDDVWHQIFQKHLEDNNYANLEDRIKTFINNYVKYQINNQDYHIINNYLKSVITPDNLTNLKNFYQFFIDLNIPLSNTYFDILKNNTILKNILTNLGIFDFDNELCKYYLKGYFNFYLNLKSVSSSLSSVISKVLEIREYQLEPNLSTTKINCYKLLINNYDMIKPLYNACYLKSSNITLQDFKVYLYNLEFKELNKLINTYRLNKVNSNTILNILNNLKPTKTPSILTDEDIITKLSKTPKLKTLNNKVRHITSKKIYNNLSPIKQNILKLYFYHITTSLGNTIINNLALDIVPFNVYTFIDSNKYENSTYIDIINHLLKLETPKNLELINLYFANEIKDEKTKKYIYHRLYYLKQLYNIYEYVEKYQPKNLPPNFLNIFLTTTNISTKISICERIYKLNYKRHITSKEKFSHQSIDNLSIAKEPNNSVPNKERNSNIYAYLLLENEYDYEQRKIVNYFLSIESFIERKNINMYFNNELTDSNIIKKTEAKLLSLKDNYHKFLNPSNRFKTKNKVFDSLYHQIKIEDTLNINEDQNIYNDLVKFYDKTINNPFLTSILSSKLARLITKRKNFINNYANCINSLSFLIGDNLPIISLLLYNLKSTEINLLNNYFLSYENEKPALEIIKYLTKSYNYYLDNNKLPSTYSIDNYLLKLNINWFKQDALKL